MRRDTALEAFQRGHVDERDRTWDGQGGSLTKAAWWLCELLTKTGSMGHRLFLERHEFHLVMVKFEVIVRHLGKEIHQTVEWVDLGWRDLCICE